MRYHCSYPNTRLHSSYHLQPPALDTDSSSYSCCACKLDFTVIVAATHHHNGVSIIPTSLTYQLLTNSLNVCVCHLCDTLALKQGKARESKYLEFSVVIGSKFCLPPSLRRQRVLQTQKGTDSGESLQKQGEQREQMSTITELARVKR